MTVSIFNNPNVSLCYKVHGQANGFFNLISDNCVTVNTHYARVNINSPNIDMNVVDVVGVRGVSNNGTCVNIKVSLQGCRATVDGQVVNMYQVNGITVNRYLRQVRITVPNCGDMNLVTWVFCSSGSTEDPVTWKYFSIY